MLLFYFTRPYFLEGHNWQNIFLWASTLCETVTFFQNENSAMWLHGANSRTMPAVPGSTYYNYQGQNQQSGGFRQGQQPSQNYGGALGYPNFYHSQTGVSLDQQQNPRDGSLGGSQGQQPKQSQIWQNSY